MKKPQIQMEDVDENKWILTINTILKPKQYLVDKQERAVSIITQSIGGKKIEKVPFEDISDVFIEYEKASPPERDIPKLTDFVFYFGLQLVIKLTNGEEIPITAVRVTSLTFKKEISFSSIELFDARNKLIKSILVGRNRDITWLSSDMKIVELSKNAMILEYIVSRSKKGNEALQTERIKIDSSEKKFILENVGQVQVYEKKTACFIEQIRDVVLLVKPGFTRNPNDLPRANFSYEVRINLNDASDILVVKTERFDEGFDLVNCLKRYIKYCRNGESSTELNQFDHSYDKMLEKSQHQQPLEKSD